VFSLPAGNIREKIEAASEKVIRIRYIVQNSSLWQGKNFSLLAAWQGNSRENRRRVPCRSLLGRRILSDLVFIRAKTRVLTL
jgi:hypothetical protein